MEGFNCFTYLWKGR